MTSLRGAAIAVAVVALSLSTTAPAAASALDYSISPSSGTAGTTITVRSISPCPTPPSGSSHFAVEITVLDHSFQTAAGDAQVLTEPDGNWATDVQISPSVRNGAYRVFARCFASDGEEATAYALYEPVKDFVVTSPSGQSDPVLRVAGIDRIGTAVAASQDIFKTGGGVPAVVLSRDDSFADALAGTPLAADVRGPLLLTPKEQLDPRTEQEIKRVLVPNGQVFLLGGTEAVSDNVASALRASGYTVTRLAGFNRYETAVRIADDIANASGSLTTILLANGNDFHDGLIAGAAAQVAANPAGVGGTAGAVLLTNGESMPPETTSWLDAHDGVTRFAVGEVASKAAPTASGIVGTDFADTSRKVAERFYASPANVAFASAANFPDALSGGAHAAAFDAPLLFTDPNALPASINGYLVARKSQLAIGFVYGGTAAISEQVRTAIVQAIS